MGNENGISKNETWVGWTQQAGDCWALHNWPLEVSGNQYGKMKVNNLLEEIGELERITQGIRKQTLYKEKNSLNLDALSSKQTYLILKEK